MNNAIKTVVATFGTIMGLAGMEHGVGEILQGSRAPEGLVFPSWPGAAFFAGVAYEPAMSIIPNLLATGILAVLFSLAYIAFATLYIHRKHSGVIMMALAMAMLLAGGGIFPPVIGLAIAGLATRVKSPLTAWQTELLKPVRKWLSTVWRVSFILSLICWLGLFPGSNLLYYMWGINDPNLTIIMIGSALGSQGLTMLAGVFSDARKGIKTTQQPATLKQVQPAA